MYDTSPNFRRAALLSCLLLVAPTVHADYRTIDGSGNNVTNATWGAAGTELLRAAPADYPGDGLGGTLLSSSDRANPRAVSNAIFASTGSRPSARGLSAGVWQWGQFLDHDLSLTPSNPADPAMMFAPQADPFGMTMIPFDRSLSHTDGSGVRQHANEITSFIDASMVYGSETGCADALREFSGGRLRTSGGGLLMPTNAEPGLGGLDNDGGPIGASTLFVAGDIRANEQTGLIAMHTLFVREHNRLAGALGANYPAWDDERLYQTARSIVGAQVQAITYNEFLPALLGPYAPSAADYQYDPNVDATIATEFSTAFYRLGHSMLNESLLLTDAAGVNVGSLSLRESFFDPQAVIDSPELVDQVLTGLMSQAANELDTQLIDGVRNFLFAPQGGVGTDLAALNIQRGRDHGLPDYNTLRGAFGLAPVASFSDITTDAVVQGQLQAVYGDVDNIDPWVGALAEDYLPGASTGELMTVALIDQFVRLRDGDRFFYTGDDYLFGNEIASTIDFDTLTMGDILVWNTAMDYEGMPGSFFMPFAIPEPSSMALTLLVGAAGVGRRRRCCW
ncbi:MAG: peroxidase family protein [Planctomycetota bacterium]